MKKALPTVFTVLGLIALVVLVSAADGYAAHGEKKSAKKAILLAAFGTTVPEARKALDHVEGRVREAFPGVEVRWSYTSTIVRKKLAGEGIVFDSPETALSGLMDEGFTHVAVLSLHTVPGEEYHALAANARLFGKMAGGFEKIAVALPLLSSHDDTVRVARAMAGSVPAGRKPEDAVLLMGHGNGRHPSDALYSALNMVLQETDPNVFVATVEGYPSLESVLPRLKATGVKKVYLMPFMAVAGDHARNDMAGDNPDSWKSVLEKEGYACEAVMKGTAEYPDVVNVWIDHLRASFAHLQ